MQGLMRAIRGESTKPVEEKQPVPEKKPLEDLSIINEITAHYANPSTRGFRPGIHPSEISYEDPFCPRWHVFRRELVRAQKEQRPFPFGVNLSENAPDPDLMRIFDMGHAIHDRYQNNILGPAGVLYGFWDRWNNKTEKWEQSRGFRPEGRGWRYNEPRVRSKGITGQCDGIVRIDGVWLALEIKSSNDQGFTFRKKVKREHIRQAQVYANMGFVDFPEIEVDGIVFLYVNKNTSKEREFIVPKKSAEIQDIIDGLEKLAEHDRIQSLPSRQCVRKSSKRANACPVKETCFTVGSGVDALVQIKELGLASN